MSSGNGRVVQYGRRSSNKQKRPPTPLTERTPKRQKLMEDDIEEVEERPDSKHVQEGPLLPAPSHRLGTKPSAVRISFSKKNNLADGLAREASIETESATSTRPNSPEPTHDKPTLRSSPQRPKDLSGIFAPLPQLSPGAPLTPKRSLTKRMLVRSRTEPSLGSNSPSPNKTTLTPAFSSPNLSASPSKSDIPRRSSPPPSPSTPLSTHRRTYSHSRSFLVTLPASAAEIVSKMCEAEFARKAKAADFNAHAWDALRTAGAGDGDKILDIHLLAFVALVARDKRDLLDLSHKSGFYDVMIKQLQRGREDDGLEWLRKSFIGTTNYSKREKAALTRIRNVLLTKAAVLPEGSSPSSRLLSSHSLSRLSGALDPPELLPATMGSLLDESKSLDSEFEKLPTLVDSFSIDHISNCLDILDALLLRFSDESYIAQVDKLRDAFYSRLSTICLLPRFLQSGTHAHDVASHAMETAIRILITLSHISTEWCSKIVEDNALLSMLVREICVLSIGFIKAEPGTEDVETKSTALDRQSISLALLSNLVLTLEQSKHRLQEISLDTSCSQRQCVKACKCSQRINAIECLCQLFEKVSVKMESADMEDIDFFRDHLSALLCLLAIGNETNEGLIRSNLTSKPQSLGKHFSQSVQSFLELYGISERGQKMHMKGDIQAKIAAARDILCS
ncbi:hypothetical protein M422DRAFT_784397 [Sphaerobolus stellatus SS14]|uniref:Wings apart-like protein C-terminal domain-containing protein n=1 Tax=Sphaerobolus stellatus (strain SS14) TaxID=990650 RepID=A0A0C9UUV3_SPHS4|nr:hypothetical protein M422DRAFT_784397 [Sphaerobolus stellatus SS14]